MTEALTLDRVSARYGATRVLEDLSLSVAAGELVALLGASGCGKTTTLRLVAGFLEPDAGRITLGGRDLTRLPAWKRDIGLVFQSYALFPHLTVAGNVGFGLVQRRVGAAERARRVAAMLERTGLSEFAERLPAALSGGQRQRVALARALVIEPPLLMLDEPLSNLDARLRLEMRGEIRTLQRAQGATALYVTHDQEEAFSISDRVAVMAGGRILQFDRPEAIYRRPADPYVARFVGFENLIPLSVTMRNGGMVRAGPLHLPEAVLGPIPDRFTLAARPEGLRVGTGAEGFRGRIRLRTYLGRSYLYLCDTEVGALSGAGPLSTPFEPGTAVALLPDPDACAILPA